MATLLSEYEEMKVKLRATKQHLEDTSCKTTDLAKLQLEAMLGGQREQPLELKMKELVLQKVWLVRTRMEQEKRKRAITDFMAGHGAQLEDMEAKAKAPLEAERVRQDAAMGKSERKEEAILPPGPAPRSSSWSRSSSSSRSSPS